MYIVHVLSRSYFGLYQSYPFRLIQRHEAYDCLDDDETTLQDMVESISKIYQRR